MSFEDVDVEDLAAVRWAESAREAGEEAHGWPGGGAAGGGVVSRYYRCDVREFEGSALVGGNGAAGWGAWWGGDGGGEGAGQDGAERFEGGGGEREGIDGYGG